MKLAYLSNFPIFICSIFSIGIKFESFEGSNEISLNFPNFYQLKFQLKSNPTLSKSSSKFPKLSHYKHFQQLELNSNLTPLKFPNFHSKIPIPPSNPIPSLRMEGIDRSIDRRSSRRGSRRFGERISRATHVHKCARGAHMIGREVDERNQIHLPWGGAGGGGGGGGGRVGGGGERCIRVLLHPPPPPPPPLWLGAAVAAVRNGGRYKGHYVTKRPR